MPLFKKTLCGIDGSTASIYALDQIIALHPVDLELTLVAVVPPMSVEYEGITSQTQLRRNEKASTEALAMILQGYLNKAQKAGISSDMLLDVGQPHQRIADLAQEKNVSVIVLGVKRGDYLKRRLLGSNASRIIGYSHCDVLMIPQDVPLQLGSIMAATDGSRYGTMAVARAVALAREQDAKLTIVTVIKTAADIITHTPDAQQISAAERNANAALEKAAASARKGGIVAKTCIRHGDAYEQIAENARDVDAGLIVVGSHGRTGLTRLLMGSVTERVVEVAPCPVLVTKAA